MARVGRIAGAILVETDGRHYLVGNPKRPCEWTRHGFEPPGEIEATKRPWTPLCRSGPVAWEGPSFAVELEGEAVADAIARRLLIERNGSVSERLWRLVFGETDGAPAPESAEPIGARWLVEVPEPVWRIVRDTVLRCV